MLIIDRIEDGIAVIEDGNRRFEILASRLPEGAREGSVLVPDGDGFSASESKTAERRRKLSELTGRLFKE